MEVFSTAVFIEFTSKAPTDQIFTEIRTLLTPLAIPRITSGFAAGKKAQNGNEKYIFIDLYRMIGETTTF